jgi:hypothetical protein
VTFDKHLKEVLSNKLESASTSEVAEPPEPFSSALEGELSDVATTTDASIPDDDTAQDPASHMLHKLVVGEREVRKDEGEESTGLETGLRQRVATLEEETALFFLYQSQLAVRRAAESLLHGIDKLERQAQLALQNSVAAAAHPGSPGRSPRRCGASGGNLWGASEPPSPAGSTASLQMRQFPSKSSLSLVSSPRAPRAAESDDASERPEGLWKQFLQGLAPLLREQMPEGASAAGGGRGGDEVVEVIVNRQELYRLISNTARHLSVCMDQRLASKSLALSLQIANMRFRV